MEIRNSLPFIKAALLFIELDDTKVLSILMTAPNLINTFIRIQIFKNENCLLCMRFGRCVSVEKKNSQTSECLLA